MKRTIINTLVSIFLLAAVASCSSNETKTESADNKTANTEKTSEDKKTDEETPAISMEDLENSDEGTYMPLTYLNPDEFPAADLDQCAELIVNEMPDLENFAALFSKEDGIYQIEVGTDSEEKFTAEYHFRVNLAKKELLIMDMLEAEFVPIADYKKKNK